jgi:uncharacterized membrane protein
MEEKVEQLNIILIECEVCKVPVYIEKGKRPICWECKMEE